MQHKLGAHLVLFSAGGASLDDLKSAAEVSRQLTLNEIPFTMVEFHRRDDDGFTTKKRAFCCYLAQNPGSHIFQEQKAIVYALAKCVGQPAVLCVSPERTAFTECWGDRSPDDSVLTPVGKVDFVNVEPRANFFVKYPS